MNKHQTVTLGFVLLLALVTLACSVPFIGPAEPPATPTPVGDTITYNVPAFAYDLAAGESVPGTRLEYVGKNNDTFEVRIDGDSAFKRSGDSFFWSGTVAPGVITCA